MILDDQELIKKTDKSNLRGSIEMLPDQCFQIWNELKKFTVPKDFLDISKIVISGMGGSGLGPHVVKSVFGEILKVPLEIVNSSLLPEYVDKKTLVILSSYSGNTEEVLLFAKKALDKKIKCLGITTGGELEKLLWSYNSPCFKINPLHNPCNQPRMGLGYSILGIAGLLCKLSLLQINDKDVESLREYLLNINQKYGILVSSKNNYAKKIAERLFGKATILVAAEFLAGSIHTWQNQQHEVAKNYGSYYLLPELDHHLLEGLKFPVSNRNFLIGIFVNSKLYDQSTQKMLKITKEIFEKNEIEVCEYECEANNKFFQSMEVIHFASYVNFYLAILNKVDPSPIPWVEYFKKELKK